MLGEDMRANNELNSHAFFSQTSTEKKIIFGSIFKQNVQKLL